jgi:hypothetical protein
MDRTPSLASTFSFVSTTRPRQKLQPNIIYHRVYDNLPTRSELAPSQLTDEGVHPLPVPPPPPGPSSPRRDRTRILATAPISPRPQNQNQNQNQSSRPELAQTKKLRLVCISDTHNHTSIPLPLGDILIHAGDLTNQGLHKELSKQLLWLQSQPHELKLIISGNHDGRTLDPSYSRKSQLPEDETTENNLALFFTPEAEEKGIIYLCHEARTLKLKDGRVIKVFASPLSPSEDGLWGFGYPEPEYLERSPWANIPEDTDVVITHTPARYHLDASPDFPAGKGPGGNHGCEYLRQALWGVRPLLHVCGHIHQGRGVEKVRWDTELRHVKYKEMEVKRIEDPFPDKARRQFLVDTVRRERIERGKETLMVNASIATGSWKRGEGHPKAWGKPVVVDLEVACVTEMVQEALERSGRAQEQLRPRPSW